MRVLWDYKCPLGHEFEELVEQSTSATCPCPTCSAIALRQLAAPRIDPRLGISSDFATMGSKWAKVRRQRQQHAEKLQREHGDIR